MEKIVFFHVGAGKMAQPAFKKTSLIASLKSLVLAGLMTTPISTEISLTVSARQKIMNWTILSCRFATTPFS